MLVWRDGLMHLKLIVFFSNILTSKKIILIIVYTTMSYALSVK